MEPGSPRIKVSVGMVSSETSLCGLQMASLLVPPHIDFPLCAPIPGVSSSYKDISHVKLGPHSNILILITSLKI